MGPAWKYQDGENYGNKANQHAEAKGSRVTIQLIWVQISTSVPTNSKSLRFYLIPLTLHLPNLKWINNPCFVGLLWA
jgi:hypothetical protein